MDSNKPKTHITSSTTFKADAGFKKYHCGFFCQRKTTSNDVVDPKDTKELTQKNEQQSIVSHK